VLKLYVLYVELLLLGQNLTKLSHLQISSTFWKLSIQMKKVDPSIFVSTKPVWCFEQQLPMEVGRKYGQKLADLLWTHITIPTIEPLTFSADHTAILLLLMDQHQIWLSWLRINEADQSSREPSIHKSASNLMHGLEDLNQFSRK